MTENCLLEPITLKENNSFQLSIHKCSRSIQRYVSYLFNDKNIEDILILPTLQHSNEDLVNIGEKIENEKDRLLINFIEFAKKLSDDINERGYWCDYIDPCSGLPMNDTKSNRTYNEVEGVQTLLNYRVMNAGCCKILLHPQWGSAVYPASIFTTIPLEELLQILQKYI